LVFIHTLNYYDFTFVFNVVLIYVSYIKWETIKNYDLMLYMFISECRNLAEGNNNKLIYKNILYN